MAYLETSFIIAYGIENDPNHERAVELAGKIQGGFYTSGLTLVELYCVLYRNLRNFRLPDELERIVEECTKVRATAGYLLRLLNVKVVDDEALLEGFDGSRLFHIKRRAIELAHLKLRALDTIHIAYAEWLARKNLVKYFVTLDREVAERAKEILKMGVEIVSPWLSSTSTPSSASDYPSNPVSTVRGESYASSAG